MSSISRDLGSFLEVVDKLAASATEASASLSDVRDSLQSAGLLTLGRDTAEEEDSLQWLTHTVRVAAQSSPSLAFLLAARYAADRALGPDTSALDPTFCLITGGSDAVVATAFEPDVLVVLDVAGTSLAAVPWTELADSVTREARSGLKAAGLVTVDVPGTGTERLDDAAAALGDWDMLMGAALVGLAERAVRTTQAYVTERRQFGATIGSFAGLRALVGDMDLKSASVQALLEVCTERGAGTENVAASAGRAAIEICIDAIQAHGGYGYIDEYPLAGLLRDAISIQARAGGRRLHLARIAERGLGPRDAGTS